MPEVIYERKQYVVGMGKDDSDVAKVHVKMEEASESHPFSTFGARSSSTLQLWAGRRSLGASMT